MQYIRANPRPVTPVQEALTRFFDTYMAGSPTSESGLAHINSAIPVNGKSGLYKTFVRMNPLMPMCFSTFASNLEIYFRKKGFKGLDKARVTTMCVWFAKARIPERSAQAAALQRQSRDTRR